MNNLIYFIATQGFSFLIILRLVHINTQQIIRFIVVQSMHGFFFFRTVGFKSYFVSREGEVCLFAGTFLFGLINEFILSEYGGSDRPDHYTHSLDPRMHYMKYLARSYRYDM